MVDYDKAVATVQDPNADPVLLAKIAYENPEFGANVAVNPRCYPGLKRWLATFGDERARQTLAQMGVTAEDGPVARRAAGAGCRRRLRRRLRRCGPVFRRFVQRGPIFRRFVCGIGRAAAAGTGPVHGGAVRGAAGAPSHQPYGYTAQMALETTDQELIAKIAQYAPELRPCIARNPSTYPALVDWLAQLNDPAVNAALATRQ